MAEDGNGFNCENGSSKNQTSTSEKKRRASKEANHVWAPLKQRKAPRGNPEAAAAKRWSVSEASSSKSRRTNATIAESAAKELESLAVHMPNVSDSDARAFALRMYYIEVFNGMSPTDAQTNVSQMFLVSSRTVQRWVELWESTGEEALLDGRSSTEESDPSILFSCPDLVFELKCWIKKRLAQGGKHKDGYLTIQQVQSYINDDLLKDEDIVPTELLDMHEQRYHSREVSRITALRWVHKLGFKWADSSAAPFCDRHEDADVVAYRKVWVEAMLALRPRLPILSEISGRPEWPNLPAGEKPLMHGNHDEAILYANEGNRFAWISNDSYHLKPKGDGATIMVSGVSVACHGWLGLETIEPKTDGTWNHVSIMKNVTTILDQFEVLYPGCQLLLTYDNAPSHVAKRKGALSTTNMNKTDGGAQPILTQMGWYNTINPSSGAIVQVQQQMWYPGPNGEQIAKGALRICTERGLPGVEGMRRDELRTLLAAQPDFANVKPEIQEEVERRGHILLFGPKCHPECMHIEMCWAHVKKYCRQHCGHTITALRTSLEHALSQHHLTVQLHTAFSNHAWKWIEAYCNEANGFAVYEALKALKKTHRHHRRGSNKEVPVPICRSNI